MLILILVSFSCSNDEVNTSTNAQDIIAIETLVGKWQYEANSINSLNECDRRDILEYNIDNTTNYVIHTRVGENCTAQSTNGTWTLSGNVITETFLYDDNTKDVETFNYTFKDSKLILKVLPVEGEENIYTYKRIL